MAMFALAMLGNVTRQERDGRDLHPKFFSVKNFDLFGFSVNHHLTGTCPPTHAGLDSDPGSEDSPLADQHCLD